MFSSVAAFVAGLPALEALNIARSLHFGVISVVKVNVLGARVQGSEAEDLKVKVCLAK